MSDLQRDEAASWLLSLTAHFEFSNETFFLGIDYLDRFLSVVKVKRHHLLLLATTCFMIASKLQEESDDQPTLAELVSVGNHTFRYGPVWAAFASPKSRAISSFVFVFRQPLGVTHASICCFALPCRGATSAAALFTSISKTPSTKRVHAKSYTSRTR